jgi:methionine-rich copper-binding protein CopC
MRRVLSLAGVGGLVLAGSVLGLAAPAQAHDYLVGSTPEVGSTVTELPEVISVTANDALVDLSGEGSGFGLLVQDADGLYYGDGCVTLDGATMSTPSALGPAGTYTVTWQLVSADSHPVSDTFTFEWAPAADATLSEGATEVPNCAGVAETPRAAEGTDDAASAAIDPTIVWIVGAVIAVVLAAGLTLLVTRRR